MNNNIHSRIESFIEKYSSNYLNEFSKEILQNNANFKGHVKILHRNIFKNYANKNQFVYNYIVSSTINKMMTYLGYSVDYFIERVKFMLHFEKKHLYNL